MNQRELNEAVALATGEDLQTIRQLGFSEVPPGTVLDEAALLHDLDLEPCL